MKSVGLFFKNIFQSICQFFHYLNKKDGFKSFLAALISILLGVFFGFIVMLCIKPDAALAGVWELISEGWSTKDNITRVVYTAVPMVFSGLSIAFSFKLGLFNIGITGQVAFGAFCSICLGLSGCNWFVCLLMGALAGAFSGFLVGFFKAKFGVNEVLSGIMLNWILYYVVGLIGKTALPTSFKDRNTPSELMMMPESARMPSLGIEGAENLSVGIIFAVLAVVIIYVILNHTTFGFELKMTGRNADASRNAGVNQKRTIILSLTISGLLAGICGYMIFSNPISPTKYTWDSTSNTLLSDGFNGISVSLIAQNSPLGVIFSSLLLTTINASQNSLKTVSDGAYNVHYTELIKSVVIYIAALSSFFFTGLRKINEKNDTNEFFVRTKKEKKGGIKA